jgi:PAS domain S-box-containing protein
MTQTMEKTTKTQSTQRQVPSEIVQKWQEIVDLLAEIMHVPSALVMRVEPPNIKVFVSSKSEGNPYEPDEVASLNTGLYCETVMKTRQPLLVPDALQDEEWKSNPDIKLGMISYLGFPVSWPDGEIFGTICVLDNKKNEYGELYRKFLLQYRDVLQADLRSLATVHAELTTQKAHLEELFARMPEAIVQLDGGGRLARVNPEFTKIFGYAEGEVLGRSLDDLIVPEELRAEAKEFTSRVNDRREIQTVETVRSRKNGTRVPVSIVRVPVMSEGRQISEYAIYRDITEHKRAEEAARRSEKALREVIETIPAMVWSALPDGSIDFINQRWQEFTGLSLEESLGWNWEAPIHPEDHERYVGKWRTSIATGQPFEAELRIRRAADGEYRWFMEGAVPLRDEQGNILKWYGVVADIDDRKRAEEALHQAQAELAHVTRVVTMGELASSIAHEVNQPLAGLVTNGQACLRWLARDPPDLAEARACLQRVVRDGTRAGEVIARMRAFARKAAPQPARLALNDVIAEVLALADDELRRHGVALHTDLAAGLLLVWGDRVQLQQVLLNLLLNGVEAMRGVTDRPRALLVRSRKDGAEGVLVAVQDAGPGIAPQDLERVFEPFYTTKPTGLGLGLAISRSIIEAHGGRLWATPNAGPGVTMQFTLPKGVM